MYELRMLQKVVLDVETFVANVRGSRGFRFRLFRALKVDGTRDGILIIVIVDRLLLDVNFLGMSLTECVGQFVLNAFALLLQLIILLQGYEALEADR